MTKKLVIKTIRARNFRSIGNKFLELDLTKSNTTLICSNDNGFGKSTLILHSLFFCFFDKGYERKQKKSSLLNSINLKDCIVEVEFTIKGHLWLVRRGIKPNVFDIMKDGVRVEDEAARGDYQGYLQDVIGFDDKTFCNMVVLGKDQFVPFVEMSVPERRAHGEKLLDLYIFSQMNKNAKDRLKVLNRTLDDINYKVGITSTEVDNAKKLVSIIENQIRKYKDDKQERIDILNVDIAGYNKVIADENAKIETLAAEARSLNYSVNNTKLAEFEKMKIKFDLKIKELEGNKENINHLAECPTCKQNVSESVRAALIAEIVEQEAKFSRGLVDIDSKIIELKVPVDRYTAIANEVKGLQNVINLNKSLILKANKSITELGNNRSLEDEQKNLLIAQTDLDDHIINLNELVAQQDELKDDVKVHTDLLVLLEDGGVKAEIVKQYIPYLNQKINEYLDKMGLYLNIVISEEFDISMNAPNRKGQAIADLSSGQRRRIDLAVLLAWKDIASIRSSVDTNLLVMDEILESLSEIGVSEFMDFFREHYNKSSDINLFVISQRKGEMQEYFDSTVEVGIKDGFSYIKEIS